MCRYTGTTHIIIDPSGKKWVRGSTGCRSVTLNPYDEWESAYMLGLNRFGFMDDTDTVVIGGDFNSLCEASRKCIEEHIQANKARRLTIEEYSAEVKEKYNGN